MSPPTKKAAAKKPAAKSPAAKQPAPGNKAIRRRPGKNFWLVKTEPSVYSIDDLARDGTTMWEGVRNYQARNLMRDEMRAGDRVFVYHSNADPMAIVGLGEVAGEAYPDPTAFQKQSKYFDPKSKRDEPTWMLVDIAHVETYPAPLDRETLMACKPLAKMMLLQKGSRLSVQPVTPAEAKAIAALVRKGAKTAG